MSPVLVQDNNQGASGTKPECTARY